MMTHTHAKGYVDPTYLAMIAEQMKEEKERSYALLHLQPGQRILEVGCGPGTDTIPLAHLVGPAGAVVGVDIDADMLALARQRATQAEVAACVTHQQADATALPFADASFDACRCERVLQHVIQPEQAIAEMVRVTKPGGWILVGEPDWGTHSIDTPEVEIERRLARVHAERCVYNGYVGRHLYRLFKQHGLQEISVRPVQFVYTQYALARDIFGLDLREREGVARGVVSDDDVQRWCASLEHAEAEGAFFGSLSGVSVVGRR